MPELTTPLPDRRAAETLRTIFERARFTEDAIEECSATTRTRPVRPRRSSTTAGSRTRASVP
jgi:hypothetical protein